VVGSSILEKKRQLELKIREAQRQLREVNARRRERIEQLGNILRRFDMGLIPGMVMLIALVLGIWRSVRRRHYISHASDA
jgi:ABC-2 type transport system permease protein